MAARPASCAQSAVPGARCRFLRESPLEQGRRRPATLLREVGSGRLLLEMGPARARRAATFVSRTGSPVPAGVAPRRGLRQQSLARSAPRSGSSSASARPASDPYRSRTRPASPCSPSRVRPPSELAALAEGWPLKPCQSQIAYRRRRPQVALLERFWPTPGSSRASALPGRALPAAWIPADSLVLIPNRWSVYP
jgi:hypothetical protein